MAELWADEQCANASYRPNGRFPAKRLDDPTHLPPINYVGLK